MKILVCYECRVRPDSTGVYFYQAFKQLGHEVDHCLPENIHNIKGGYDLYFKCDDGIRSSWNKDLHPSVYQVIDTHIESDWRVKLASEGEFDLVAVAQKEGLNLPWTNKKVIWGPLGCDWDAHCVGPREKKYDVAAIMNFHSQYAAGRIDLVHELFKAVPNFFFGGRMFHEMAEKFSESRLVFNAPLNKDLNMRHFEAMASGSVLVSERLEDAAELGFIDGVHYAGYSSKEEMIKVVADLLKDSAKMDYLAKNGHSEVRNHTYTKRVENILQELH